MRHIHDYVIPILGLGLIAWGLWWVYPPVAPVVVGGLLWLDMTIEHLGKKP